MPPLKDVFSPALVACIADQMVRTDLGFDRRKFEGAVLDHLEGLELMARARLIATELARALPASTKARHEALRVLLHPDETGTSVMESDERGIRGWAILPLTLIVGQNGQDDLDGSLDLLKHMTKRFTSEFGIRYCLQADQPRTLETLAGWVDDPCPHVRRLVSEGTRPRLPWAPQLPNLMANPLPVIPLLERLRDDPHEYVRRSVANHMNDISKNHPDMVARIAKVWMKDASENRRRMLRHACRTLIKNGHADTLATFGYQRPDVRLENLVVTPERMALPADLVVTADLFSKSSTPQPVVIDYVVSLLKANGCHTPKVFKGSTTVLSPGKILTVRKRIPFRQISTRRYYTGPQHVSLRINGEDIGKSEFHLTVS